MVSRSRDRTEEEMHPVVIVISCFALETFLFSIE